MPGVQIAELAGITLDVRDLELEARFWGAALGMKAEMRAEGWATFEPLPGGLALDLQQVPEAKVGKNRSHMDLSVRTGADGIDRLVALGATVVEHVDKGANEWFVMADPEGNEFCAVVRHVTFED